MLLYTLGLQFTKKEDYTFPRKKTRKTKSATIMISVGGKGTVFPVKLKLQGESFV